MRRLYWALVFFTMLLGALYGAYHFVLVWPRPAFPWASAAIECAFLSGLYGVLLYGQDSGR